MTACKQAPPAIEFQLFANGEKVLSILPEDIAYYDTSQIRGNIEIHELRLTKQFYSKDSLVLDKPLSLRFVINNNCYYQAVFFHQQQSQPTLGVNFKFRSSCENFWNFQKQNLKGVTLETTDSCNSIELFHQRNLMNMKRTYFEGKQYFTNYLDTARLAHEILYDPYYLNALKAAGVELK